ncbi:MAG: hypothetical protein LC750_08340 [Actinobacteria bacterium]|nr:hypothetical protein [Actinomycetota bacterium]
MSAIASLAMPIDPYVATTRWQSGWKTAWAQIAAVDPATPIWIDEAMSFHPMLVKSG